MSTTVVSQLRVRYDFVVITVKENDSEEEMKRALSRVDRSSLFDEDGDLDEIEMRAAISSELKREDLNLAGLQVAALAPMRSA
jgi:hypothetical protein